MKKLGKKTWIDWLKAIVAIDIASVGIALIIGENFHILANIFGFLTRIIFGILYIFIAVLIFKRVFPEFMAGGSEAGNTEENSMDLDVEGGVKSAQNFVKKIATKAEKVVENATDALDNTLEKAEDFVIDRKNEANEEIKNLMK